jgi:hypothetical protein
MSVSNPMNPSPFGMVLKMLPGPDRKRSPNIYTYRITYRNPKPVQPGCVMTWEVAGGRTAYQIALERTGSDMLRWHCTCADAVYREHVCKHVLGLIECTPLAEDKETRRQGDKEPGRAARDAA